MVIDIEARAKSLGVDYADYRKASDSMNDLLWDLGEDYDVSEYLKAVKSLPEPQMVAYVRWNHLDKRFPAVFTRDGLRGMGA